MKLRSFSARVLLSSAALLLAACGEGKKVQMTATQPELPTAAQWGTVARRRIVFAHQSVGTNILSGIKALAQEGHVDLKVTEGRSAAAGPGIVHFRVGKNEDPLSKLDEFAAALSGGAAAGADVALLKFCYVDFNAATDAKELARRYCATLEALGRRFPQTTFVAVTAPLTTVQQGPKAWLKRLAGRTPGGYAENGRRGEFNAVLRKTFGPGGRLFDLASIEAMGAPAATYRGAPLELLNPALTSDGGHLNPAGEKAVAARLVSFLAALPAPRRP